MRIDFWNNPLVVSAFRVKYRRGGLFNFTAGYLLLLVVGGAVLYHYQDKIQPWSWPKAYLLGILAVQCFLSAIMAASTTAASLRSEVMNRTLDFQRLVAISPEEILLGKLLGEAAVAFLLIIASFPLAAWCVAMGVAGVSLGTLLLIYLNIVSSTVLVSALGLLQPLEPPAGKAPGTPSGSAGIWGVVAVMFVVQTAVGAQVLLAKPWSAAIVGLVTPLPVFFGLGYDDPWRYCLNSFGLQIPFILVTPISELMLAYLIFRVMVRRLINPLNPAFRKKLAYLTLVAVDVLAGAALFEPPAFGLSLVSRTAGFGLAHLLAGVWLTTAVTPWKESLQSWIWRFRGRVPRLQDLWLGERSENGLGVLTFAVIGLVDLVLLVLVPFGLENGFDQLQRDFSLILSVAAASTLLLLTLGIMYQWCAALAGRNGKGIFGTMVLFLVVPAHITGYYYSLPILLAITPSAHFASWFTGSPPPSLLPLVIVYAVGLYFIWLSLRRSINRTQHVVQQKLELMGVSQAPA